MGIITSGVYIGIGITLLGGGFLIDYLTEMGGLSLPVIGYLKPWQATFMLVGVPGLFVALGASASLLGPAYTLGTTGNAFQAGVSYGTSYVVKKATGKTTSENVDIILKKIEVYVYRYPLNKPVIKSVSYTHLTLPTKAKV